MAALASRLGAVPSDVGHVSNVPLGRRHVENVPHGKLARLVVLGVAAAMALTCPAASAETRAPAKAPYRKARCA